ncbi:MAG: hypothetical protein MMC23_004584 [Stictis urceolatum]|nr:hypothetical protein [Stictis urceolata]
MPQYNVILKDGADQKKLDDAKSKAQSSGGTIVNEFNLIKGFTVSYPEGHVDTLSSDDSITVEADSEMKTQ